MANRKRSDREEPPTATKKAKHRLGFNPEWKTSYPWVILATSDEGDSVTGLFCSLCQRHNSKQRNNAGTWTERPCTYLRKDMLERHKKSKMHADAEKLEEVRLASVQDGGLGQSFSSRIMVQRHALIGGLKLMYWLAKEEIPHSTKFSSLIDLSVGLGSDFLRNLCLGGNANYRSEQSIRELIHCLALVIEEQILADLRASKYFSLMTDESTDVAVLKQLVLVVKYLTDDGVKTSFLNIRDIHNGTAETIERAIVQCLSDRSVDISKLRGFGSDGASVMTGRVSGVATRLKKHSPRVISVHCVNHRLALAAAHAADGIPYLQRFKTLLQTLFYFFQNSTVRMASFHAIQEALDDPIIKCKQAKDVRWLSHDMAIKAVIRTLPSLLVALDREASENSEPTAHSLYKFMKSYKFVAVAYLLSDVLPHLSRLSLIFQTKNVDLAFVQPCLKSMIDTISKYIDTPGPNLSKLDSVLSTDLKDFDIVQTNAVKEEFKTVKVKYLSALTQHLRDRFPDVESLNAFSIFDPKQLPSAPEDLSSYGQSKLDFLQKAYGEGECADIDNSECVSEWEGLKTLLANTYAKLGLHQMLRTLCSDASIQMMYPQLTTLASIAAMIPVSTAECERCFSTMKRVKTTLRNRLLTSTLDDLMRISIDGPPLAFDRAADIWGSMRNRRLQVGDSSSGSSS